MMRYDVSIRRVMYNPYLPFDRNGNPINPLWVSAEECVTYYAETFSAFLDQLEDEWFDEHWWQDAHRYREYQGEYFMVYKRITYGGQIKRATIVAKEIQQ